MTVDLVYGEIRGQNACVGLFRRRYKARQIRSVEEFEQLLADGRPIMLDFWKYGCGPCQVMDGIVDEVAEQFQDTAIVAKAGLENVPDLFGRFKIRSTPTFMMLKPSRQGIHVRWRHSGLVKKDVIVETLDRSLTSV